MKLLFCRACGEMRTLRVEWSDDDADWTRCKCGMSAGRYLKDGKKAEIIGRYAEVIGLDNNEVSNIVTKDRSRRGTWWIMELGAPGVRVRRIQPK